ncbi:MAG: hypothetical protein JWN02_891 [Acidobacteria bacterium]|nr:hypothetical protein [Acidobacteriota bacterium]
MTMVGRAGGAMLKTTERIEDLRQQGLEKMRQSELEDAIVLYDQALLLAEDEETRELLTINKADAMIGIERNGPEVQALPKILMRRRNLHHAFLAAYALMFKHRIQNETKRGIFYGQLALDVANEANEPLWKVGALNDLGIIYEIDSQFVQAIDCFEQALAMIELISNDGGYHNLSYGTALQNLGASKLLNGDIDTGIGIIHRSLPYIVSPSARAEAFIDLCYGYADQGDIDKARHYGLAGLELASEPRQVRNAHYLLGEVFYKAGDIETAEYHFDELAKFYPQFRNLKSLLFAIDLRSMVNLKL